MVGLVVTTMSDTTIFRKHSGRVRAHKLLDLLEDVGRVLTGCCLENSEHCINITPGWQRLAKDMPRPLQSQRHLFWGNVSRTVALASCSYQKDRSESLKKSFTKVAWHLIGVCNFHEFSVGMFANISPRSYSYLMNIVQMF